jgi:predicted  nucleic acid-binding Zn-ribbon protein
VIVKKKPTPRPTRRTGSKAHHELVDALARIERRQRASRKREVAMAGEIDKLEADVVALTAAVDKAVAFINEAKGTPARVGAANATIESKTAELDAALTP